MSGDRQNLYRVDKTASKFVWSLENTNFWVDINWKNLLPKTGAIAIAKFGVPNFGEIEPTHGGLSVKESNNKNMILINGQDVVWGINTFIHHGKRTDASKVGTWEKNTNLTSPAIFFSKGSAEYISVLGNFVQNTGDEFDTGPVAKNGTFVAKYQPAQFDTSLVLASTKEKFADGSPVTAPHGFGNAYALTISDDVYVYINKKGLYLRKQQP